MSAQNPGSRLRSRSVVAGLLAMALLASAPAAADWLVTQDGARIETRGGWEVRGQMVVFTLPNGTLSSIRASEVDLEASRAASTAAQTMAEEEGTAMEKPEAEKRPPVLVLTDEDVGHVNPETMEPQTEEAEAESETQEARGEEGPERLVVSNWQEVPDAGEEGLVLAGTLRNQSEDVVGSVGLTVFLNDEEGKLLASNEAQLTATTLKPNQAAQWRVTFPGVFSYSSVRFERRGLALAAGQPGRVRVPRPGEEVESVAPGDDTGNDDLGFDEDYPEEELPPEDLPEDTGGG